MTGTAEVFAGNLRMLRIASCLTQGGLAEKIGATQTAVSYWEAGKRQPSFEDLDELAHALDTTAAMLLADPGQLAVASYKAGRAAGIRAAAEAVQRLA